MIAIHIGISFTVCPVCRVYFLFAFEWICVIPWFEQWNVSAHCAAKNSKKHVRKIHSIPISYGIQMNLLAQINENWKVCERVCERRSLLYYHMLWWWLYADWLTDWFVNCATFRHANNLRRQTTHDHKIFISPIFVFNLWVFVCMRERERISALVHTKHIFSISLECEKKHSSLTKRAIYDNDMCEIFGFICASMLFRCGRSMHARTERMA